MEKSDWYKILAIGFVVIFVFEMVAIGALNNNHSSSGTTANSGTGDLSTITGSAQEDMTLVRYEPYIIVTGNGSAVDAAEKGLIDSGIATYEVPSAGGFVLNLKSSKDVPAAAAKFLEANATVLATATISTPSKVTVDNGSIVTKIDGSSFTMQLSPIYAEGASIPTSFTAYVQDGQLYSIGNIMFLPDYVTGARIATQLEGDYYTYYDEVAWENRSAAKAIATADNATYKEKSYVILNNATDAQLNASLSAAKAYATGAENGILSVQNGFTDKAQVATDIASAGVFGGSFPPSVASYANDSDGNLTRKLDADLKAAGIKTNFVQVEVVRLKFPDEFDYNGKTYQSSGFEVELEKTMPISGKTVWLDADFQAVGGAISKFGSIAIADDQTGGAGNSTGATITIGPNGTISINGTGAKVIGQNGTAPAAMPSHNGTSGPNASNGAQP